MAFTTVANDTTSDADHINQFTEHLEGGAGKTAAYHFRVLASNNFLITLPDTGGAQKFSIRDSALSEVFAVNSDGDVSFSGTFAPTTFTLPQSANPTPTAEGEMHWDTDDDVIKVGDGLATVTIGTGHAENHAVRHAENAGDELLIENLGTAGANNTVARSDGTGGLAMAALAHANLSGVSVNQHHNESHTIVSHSDTSGTGSELNTLTGGGETTLHSHAGGARAITKTADQTFTQSNTTRPTETSTHNHIFEGVIHSPFFCTCFVGVYSKNNPRDGGLNLDPVVGAYEKHFCPVLGGCSVNRAFGHGMKLPLLQNYLAVLVVDGQRSLADQKELVCAIMPVPMVGAFYF